MDFQAIVQLISSVGFPIVACLILGYLLVQEKQDHKEEIMKLYEAINSNTLIMTELKQLLEDLRQS